MSKLIGISTGLKNVDMAPGNIPCVVINSDFVKACSGGGDINPNIYGEEKLENTIRISDHRDSTELAMLKSAEEHNIKTLAICRGHQLLNVYKGGSLYQDLRESGFTQIEHDKPFEDARSHVHDVTIESNSKLYEIIQENEIQVNSIHHQAIN